MAQSKDSTTIMKILWECLGAEDPMLHMLEWLCDQLLEAAVSLQVGAKKHEQSGERKTYWSGYRPRRRDTRMGTIYLMVPKVPERRLHPLLCDREKA